MICTNPIYPTELDEFKGIGNPYYQKIYLKRFKKYTTFDRAYFLTTVSKQIPSKEALMECIDNPDTPIYVSCKKEQLKDLPKGFNFKQLLQHPKDFHTLFDTYIYIHSGYLDPHPRMFHECVHYGKKIIYHNPKNIHDGGYYRWKNSQEVGTKTIWMDETDDIVTEFRNSGKTNLAVIHSYLPFINGGLFDAFEYYMCFKDAFKDKVNFYLVNTNLSHYAITMSQFKTEFFNMILDKYDLDDTIIDGIKFLDSPVRFIKDYDFDSTLIVDNHTFFTVGTFIKLSKPKMFFVVDPYVPSKTDYKTLADSGHQVYNEMWKWKD